MSKCKKCGQEETMVDVTDLHRSKARQQIAANQGFKPDDMDLCTYLTADMEIGMDRVRTCPNWCFVAKGQFAEQGDKGATQ